MNTERLIADAMHKQAEQAPPEGPTLARLRTSEPKRANRTLPVVVAVSAAAAVAAGAVAIPATIGSMQPDRPEQAPVAGRAPGSLPLHYQPTWLPDGYLAKQRIAGDDYSTQLYSKDEVNPSQSFSVDDPRPEGRAISLTFTRPTGEFAGVGEEIRSEPQEMSRVNGSPGALSDVDPDEGAANLVWMPGPRTVLFAAVTGTANPAETVKRVAESVRPVRDASLQPVLQAGYFPRGTKAGPVSVRGNSPENYAARAVVAQQPYNSEPGDSMSLLLTNQRPKLPGAKPFDELGVRGLYLPARTLPIPDSREKTYTSAWLTLQRADGRWVLVEAPNTIAPDGGPAITPFSKKDLILAAKRVTVQGFDQGWIGR